MEFIILGCGSSMGVPRPDGFFGNCDPKIKRNYRTRCSALFKTSNQNILIDTSPDLRQQLLRHKIKKINKVLYSHMHGDQTHGINDLRSFYINSKTQINVYADRPTSKYLKNSFSYIFKSYSKEYPATLKLNNLPKNIFATNKNKKIKIKSLQVEHGNVKSNCFIIDQKLAYISDVSKILDKDYKLLEHKQCDKIISNKNIKHRRDNKRRENVNKNIKKASIYFNSICSYIFFTCFTTKSIWCGNPILSSS